MKGRKTTLIILGSSAILVWALVALQAIRMTGSKEPEADFDPQERRLSPSAHIDKPPSADFSDPFLKEIYEKEAGIKNEKAKNIHAPDNNIPDGPPPIVFKGLIVSSGIPAALVMQAEESVMLRRGARFRGFLIKDFSYEELNLEKEGRKYTLKIE